MSNSVTLNGQQLYEKKKIRIALVGMLLALLSGIDAVCGQVSATLAGYASFVGNEILIEETPVIVIIYSLSIVSMADLGAAIFAFLFCGATKRNPVKEIARTASLPVSWFMALGGILAGPFATGCALAAYSMCGLTVGTCGIAFTPLFVSLLSKFVFKEKLSARVYLGICILIIGTCTIAIGGSTEGLPFFYVGVAVSIFAAFCFAMEGIVSTYAADMIDEYTGCTFFRCFISSVGGIIIVAIIAAVSGNMDFLIDFYSGLWKFAAWNLLVGGIINSITYLTTYAGFVKCGPSRTLAMVYTMPIWSIFVGLAGQALFAPVYSYAYNTLTIISAVIVAIGAVIIVCKPSELVNLRDN